MTEIIQLLTLGRSLTTAAEIIDNREMIRCLINCPRVDLDTVDCDGKHLEIIARSVF